MSSRGGRSAALTEGAVPQWSDGIGENLYQYPIHDEYHPIHNEYRFLCLKAIRAGDGAAAVRRSRQHLYDFYASRITPADKPRLELLLG